MQCSIPTGIPTRIPIGIPTGIPAIANVLCTTLVAAHNDKYASETAFPYEK